MLDLTRLQEQMNALPNFNLHNGLRLTVLQEGYCECQVDIGPQSLNPQGVAHGSLLFAMCDVVTGMAAATAAGTGGRGLLTQAASIHFLRPASSGTLTAKGRMLRDGQTLGLALGEVYDEQGRLVARGEFSVWYTGRPLIGGEVGRS